jgi:hypothetical protein
MDRRGGLWIASGGDGLRRVDDPASDHPRFVRYSTREGLASDVITSLMQDGRGHIYVAGARGVDALDPETGRIRHLDAADGLAGGDIFASFCDRTGALWFGAAMGLSRLIPAADRTPEPPPIRISRMRIAGVLHPISATGERNMSGLKLGPHQNQLEIDVGTSSFHGAVRYQYRLDSGRDWSEPAETSTVSLAGLGSGSYQFEVRAVRDGIPSSSPATVSFEVLPPVWRRSWVIVLSALLTVTLIYVTHRYRVGQAVEMERVRTRIAMDLHDDIGSTLSQMSILSEVARQQTAVGPASQSLAHLAEISRGLASSMGDIVWAVNPQRDRGADLVQRMRRFGEDLLSGRNIAFDCVAADDVLSAPIPADVRREVYLIFKESVNNIARHANCRRASAQLAIAAGELQLEVRDDGAGFDNSNAANRQGQGLTSMQRRADQIRGNLKISSEIGSGTTVLLRAPLRRYLFR